MTARWSGAVLGRNGGNAAFPAVGLDVEDAGGFTHGRFGGQSPKVMFVAGARDVKRRL
jgi:hypothetical protein